jgi:hypothetical protein
MKEVESLPENAQKKLKPGKKYELIMSSDKNYSEVTVWSVVWGFAMAVVFTAAVAYPAKINPANVSRTDSAVSEIFAIIIYIAITVYVICNSMKHSINKKD